MRAYCRRLSIALITGMFFMFWGTAAFALDVNLAKDLPYVEVVHEGKLVRVQRIQNQSNVLTGGFARTSRKCPPFCIQPEVVAPGVGTVGELEIFDFMKTKLNSSKGVIIDARTPNWYLKGTIPGSINIPFTTFNLPENDPRLAEALAKLGVTKKASNKVGIIEKVKGIVGMETKPPSNWDFTSAKDILLWCNGMWCGQSPRAIHGLLKMQYPPEKIFYYRGGMQAWRILGLTVVVPGSI